MEQKRIKRIWILSLVLPFAALMAVFAFTDLSISQRLVDMDSTFGKFAECSAEVPFDLVTMFAYAVLFVTRSKKKNVWTVLAKILFFAATFEYGFFVLFYVFKYLGFSWKLWAGIAGAIPLGTLAILLAKSVIRTNRDAWVRAAVIVVITVLVQELLVNLLFKMVWARPRMRDLGAPYDAFVPWYLPRSSALGGDSFPSGHTSRAAGSFFPVLLCGIYDKLKSKRWLFILFGIIWTVLIGVGRIVLAAHFASDVTAGAFLMLLAFGVTAAAVDRVYQKRAERQSISAADDCIEQSPVVD